MVFANPVTDKHAMWGRMILREASFPVRPMGVCKWPILTVRVITLQNKVSVGI